MAGALAALDPDGAGQHPRHVAGLPGSLPPLAGPRLPDSGPPCHRCHAEGACSPVSSFQVL